jgi:hypothetical protein
MSVFDFPRVNFAGTLSLNPATANNCDYAADFVLPDGYGPSSGKPLGLIDSKLVRAITYGMDDETFITWVQHAQTFDAVSPKDGQPKTRQIIPAEWNYYGALGMGLNAQVIGVTTGPGKTYVKRDEHVPLTAVLGAPITIKGGHITDVNSEGSPPGTQFFVDAFTVANGANEPWLTGAPSKGVCQWLNFYRNVSLVADQGAGGYVYHVMRRSQPGTSITLPGFDGPDVVGVVLRYYIYGLQFGTKDNAAIEKLYQQKRANPATAQIVGTLAPLRADETVFTTPVGRLMVSNTTAIRTPGTHNNGNVDPAPPDPQNPDNLIALAPAVVHQQDMLVSVDLAGTFPDDYKPGPPAEYPKFDFGPVSLVVSAGRDSAVVGVVGYGDTDAGNTEGWVFDYDIASNEPVRTLLQDPDATFSLVHSTYGRVLDETEYFYVSNQQAIYGEQRGSGDSFLNQGATEAVTIAVFRHGEELSATGCPPFTVWQYRSVPLQAPGTAVAISTDHRPGQPVVVDTSEPGDFLFTFSVTGATESRPPDGYNEFMNPPWITNAPSISLRLLPNDEDFSDYYVDPDAPDPVGNDRLTFDVVYEKVLRTYYLLYPAMNATALRLDSEASVTTNAAAILERTDPAMWMKVGYMPKTRDMSRSRTQLLRAFCRKVSG